jgi:hypothetical protein
VTGQRRNAFRDQGARRFPLEDSRSRSAARSKRWVETFICLADRGAPGSRKASALRGAVSHSGSRAGFRPACCIDMKKDFMRAPQ